MTNVGSLSATTGALRFDFVKTERVLKGGGGPFRAKRIREIGRDFQRVKEWTDLVSGVDLVRRDGVGFLPVPRGQAGPLCAGENQNFV